METMSIIGWFIFVLFLNLLVHFVTTEYKKYQVALNGRAKAQYDGRT